MATRRHREILESDSKIEMALDVPHNTENVMRKSINGTCLERRGLLEKYTKSRIILSCSEKTTLVLAMYDVGVQLFASLTNL